MANANQGYRSGNAFGRLADIGNEAIYSQGIKLEPGYLIELRSRMHLVTAVEPMVVDLFFTDTVNVGQNGSPEALNGTDATPLTQYGVQSIQAYYDITDSDAAANLKETFSSRTSTLVTSPLMTWSLSRVTCISCAQRCHYNLSSWLETLVTGTPFRRLSKRRWNSYRIQGRWNGC